MAMLMGLRLLDNDENLTHLHELTAFDVDFLYRAADVRRYIVENFHGLNERNRLPGSNNVANLDEWWVVGTRRGVHDSRHGTGDRNAFDLGRGLLVGRGIFGRLGWGGGDDFRHCRWLGVTPKLNEKTIRFELGIFESKLLHNVGKLGDLGFWVSHGHKYSRGRFLLSEFELR